MSCDDANLLLAAQAVGSLEPHEVPALEAHMRRCQRCQCAVEQYAAVAAVLPLTLEPLEPPAALRTQLFTRIHAEAGVREHAPSLRERLRSFWAHIPASRGLTIAAAVSATAAVSLVASHQIERSIQSPAPVAIHFRGTTEAPSAEGSLTYDRQTKQAVVNVVGLLGPPAVPRTGPGSEAYEVWLIRSDNSVVAAGYLTLAPDGQAWTAAINADLSRYVGLATTVEPPGGSLTPTGPEVIHTALPDTSAS